MSDAATFEDFFTMSRADMAKPMNLPRGHYTLVLRGVFKRPPREEGKSGQVTFSYEVVEPMDDVREDELAVFMADNRNIKDSRPTADFWVNVPPSYKDHTRISDHLAVHGIKVAEGDNLEPGLKEVLNKRVIAYVSPDNYMHQVKGEILRDKASGFKPYE